jgi:hypothetical protein
MVDPDVRDWERLRKEIPAVVAPSIDESLMRVYIEMAEQELDTYSHHGVAPKAEEDVVNNPSHYNSGGIECIDAIAESMTDEGFKAYCKGNVQKYLWRYEMKGKPLEDLRKAQWYLSRLIESQECEDGY